VKLKLRPYFGISLTHGLRPYFGVAIRPVRGKRKRSALLSDESPKPRRAKPGLFNDA